MLSVLVPRAASEQYLVDGVLCYSLIYLTDVGIFLGKPDLSNRLCVEGGNAKITPFPSNEPSFKYLEVGVPNVGGQLCLQTVLL